MTVTLSNPVIGGIVIATTVAGSVVNKDQVVGYFISYYDMLKAAGVAVASIGVGIAVKDPIVNYFYPEPKEIVGQDNAPVEDLE